MKNKHLWILKRTAALLTALLLLLPALPAAFAASMDWSELQITLSWADENGENHTVYAVPAGETETGEGCFWAFVPQDAPLYSLIFSAFHPSHAYEYFPVPGSVLEGVTDAGETMDGVSYIPVSASDPETGMTEVFCL